MENSTSHTSPNAGNEPTNPTESTQDSFDREVTQHFEQAHLIHIPLVNQDNTDLEIDLIFGDDSDEASSPDTSAEQSSRSLFERLRIDQRGICFFIDVEILLERADEQGETVLSHLVEHYAPNAKIVPLLRGEYVSYQRQRLLDTLKTFNVPQVLIDRISQTIRVPNGLNPFHLICTDIAYRDRSDAACVAIVQNADAFSHQIDLARRSMLHVESGRFDDKHAGTLIEMIREAPEDHLGETWLYRTKFVDKHIAAALNDRRIALALKKTRREAEAAEAKEQGKPERPEAEAPPTAETYAQMAEMCPTPALEWSNDPPLTLRGQPWLGMQAIRPEMMGRHWLVIGETGSGKTKSVVLPLLDALTRYEINA